MHVFSHHLGCLDSKTAVMHGHISHSDFDSATFFPGERFQRKTACTLAVPGAVTMPGVHPVLAGAPIVIRVRLYAATAFGTAALKRYTVTGSGSSRRL